MPNSYDIIIVGGGPAGLTAAIYARRAEKSVLILEKNGFGGQIAQSPRVENFPGFLSISGAELSDKFFNQALELGAEADLSEVTGLAPTDEGFIVRTEDGDYGAGAVILATGARHRRLGLPREEELSGSGVCYCAVCDGAFYPGRPVAVVGGGDTAVRDALLLSNSCSEVYIIHRRHEFRAEASNVEALRARENVHFVLGARAAELLGEDELRGVVVEDVESGERRTLEVDGLFVAVGHESDNAPFAELAGVDERGWFTAGEDGVSRTPGLFVAGDCRNKRVKQLVTAAGDGAAAATSACGYLDGKAKNR